MPVSTKKPSKTKNLSKAYKKPKAVGPALRKAAMLKELVANHGRVGDACQKVGISRMTYSTWVREDPEFAREIDAMEETVNDWYEDAFKKLVKEGNPQAVIHSAKTRLRHRGYGEKLEVEAKVIGAGAFLAALASVDGVKPGEGDDGQA